MPVGSFLSYSRQILTQTYRHFRHSLRLQMLTIGIISLVMMILGVLFLFFANLDAFLQAWQQKIFTFSIYLADESPDVLIEQVISEVESFTGVSDVIWIRKEKALESFERDFPNYRDVLLQFSTNPLPDTLEVHLKEGQAADFNLNDFAKTLRYHPVVEEVDLNPAWRKDFQNVQTFIRIVGFFLGSGMIVTALFIIGFTVRLSTRSYEQECEILKLLGATDRFIRFPLILEGLLQGGTATAIGVGLLWCAFFMIDAYISEYFAFLTGQIHFLPERAIWIFMGSGCLLGGMAARISVRRMGRR